MKTKLTKEFASKLAVMIDSRLIWYKHYLLWCDEIIKESGIPPYWMIELALTKYIPDATKIIYTYINSEPFEEVDSDHLHNIYIACQLLRYGRREISWATFLHEAGRYADSCGTKVECEEFFQWLNEYEDSEFSQETEKIQVQLVERLFGSEKAEVLELYKVFEPYFKEYVMKNKG